MSSERPRVVIGAGGTGGHIYPGLATADAIRRAEPDAEITFIGTPKGLEQRLIPAEGYALELVDMVPWGGARKAPLFGAAVTRATIQAGRILARTRPQIVLGMGGYPSLPVVIAARRRGVPVILHESGAVAGRANMLAARMTRNVALAFGAAARSFPRHTARIVGMPLSAELAMFDGAALRAEARAEYDVPEGVVLVLVNGGSQGSVRLNELALGLAQRWLDRDDVRIVLKAGAAHIDNVTALVEDYGVGRVLRAVRYLDRMPTAYAAADIAVCRSGAGTVAELATCGLPAVLVPYPFAPDDHQTANARVLEEAGAALLIADHDATADTVGPELEALFGSDKLRSMVDAAGASTHAGAADALASWALELGSRTL
ncbi:MAG TPA: undecaprenyldiphospho-muramoylpentapeptide beta-N-acetylglucosaminyltransferase [Acidimicrobiales bacterium]|nr:undecaprenyldiphospho-muramoylpentapeptide beta-N-acetylglucosaminyltransferase [Acidimicrobiales bacterium]